MPTLDLTPMEHATLISLAALGVAVMQNDEERGKEHVTLLSYPGVEETAEAVLGKLVAPLISHGPPKLHMES